MGSNKPVVSTTTPTGPIVDQAGQPTFAFMKWLQGIGATINQAFDTQGSLSPNSIPSPTASSLGGVLAAGPVAHEWVKEIDVTGAPQLSRPTFSDIGGTATPAQIPALSALSGAVTPGQVPPLSALSGAVTIAQVPNLPESHIIGLTADLAAKAPIASPTFTGTVTEPDAPVLTTATTTTSATAGAATALPATPAGYLTISINGTLRKIPYFAI